MSPSDDPPVISNNGVDKDLIDVNLRLQQKREALLQSIAHSQSDHAPSEPPSKIEVENALHELTQQGYSFERIATEGNICLEFLKETFKPKNAPELRPPKDDREKTNENARSDIPKAVPNMINKESAPREDVPVLAAESKKRLTQLAPHNAKRRKVRERPIWLNDLVISLLSSDEENLENQSSTKNAATTISVPAQPVPPAESTANSINIGSEVGKISMRLKIEISRLRQRMRTSNDPACNEDTILALAGKKATMIKDIEDLFDEIEQSILSGRKS